MVSLNRIQYRSSKNNGNKRVSIQDLRTIIMTNEFLNGLNRIVNMTKYLIHTIIQTITNIMSNPPAPAPR